MSDLLLAEATALAWSLTALACALRLRDTVLVVLAVAGIVIAVYQIVVFA